MIYSEIELMEMARDYERLEAQSLEDNERLRQLQAGESVVVPVDIEHARAMFKISTYYLSQHDKSFGLRLE